MQKPKDHRETLDDLLRVARELSSLIEDNNQNIKDCYRVLQSIEKQVCPEKQSVFARAIQKLINKFM